MTAKLKINKLKKEVVSELTYLHVFLKIKRCLDTANNAFSVVY
jgi:hypothetical protein